MAIPADVIPDVHAALPVVKITAGETVLWTLDCVRFREKAQVWVVAVDLI